MIKDSQKVFRQSKGEVKYSQIEKIIPARTMGKEIKKQISILSKLIHDKNGDLINPKSLDFKESQNFYLAMKTLDSKVSYFMKHWSNFPKGSADIDRSFISNLRTILEFNRKHNLNVGNSKNKNILNTSAHHFLIKFDTDREIVDNLNIFLSDTTKFLKPKSLEKADITDCFTKTRVFIERLNQDLLEFSNKNYDLNYLAHQKLVKYNLHFVELFRKINQYPGGYHNFIKVNILQILPQLDNITIQSTAVLDLKQTLSDYLELHSQTKGAVPIQKQPQNISTSSSVTHINKNNKRNVA
jgi:hypothetical protein